MEAPPRRSFPREFVTGIGYLFRGLGQYRVSPGVMLLGAVPALIVFAVYLTLVIVMVVNLDGIVALLDPLVIDLAPALATLVRIVVGIAALGLTLVLVVVTFTAVTLAIGSPFYERIAQRTEQVLGDAPTPVEPGFWRSVGRGLGDSLVVLLMSIGVAVLGFGLGLIPLVGQFIVPVVGALFAGWFLVLELAAFSFEPRDLALRDRRHVLGRRRARSLGFGVACYLAFLVPGGAVLLMPAAVAGATMLSRDALTSAAREQAAAR